MMFAGVLSFLLRVMMHFLSVSFWIIFLYCVRYGRSLLVCPVRMTAAWLLVWCRTWWCDISPV